MGILGTNQSDARQRAYEAWKRACDAKADPRTVARLKAQLDAADAEMRSAQGK